MTSGLDKHERLSALLDGECTGADLDQLLDELEASSALRAQWDRHCLVRSALDGMPFRKPPADLCAGVMAAIRMPASVEAPLPVAAAAAPVMVPALASVGAQSGQPRRQRRRYRLAGPAFGLAAAASIAAVITITALRAPGPGSDAVAASGAATDQPQMADAGVRSTTAAGLTPVSYRETGWTELDPAAARQLDGYVIEHSGYRTMGSIASPISYARFAAHAADYRTADGSH